MKQRLEFIKYNSLRDNWFYAAYANDEKKVNKKTGKWAIFSLN